MPPPMPPVPLRVVVDADVSLPVEMAVRLKIISAPVDVPLLLERENIPRLALEAGGALDPAPAVEACRAAAQPGAAVLYVSPGNGGSPRNGDAAGDGDAAVDWGGHPTGAEDQAREAVERAGARFLYLPTEDILMAAGWRAVVAAEASAAGASPDEAVERARNAPTRLLALVEHPELAGDSMPGNPDTTNRIVTFIRAGGFSLDSMPHHREDALRRLRDRFASTIQDAAGLRVVVHHGGVAPAADAMATWIRRHTEAREVHVSAITRHAATRLGPGFVGIAWTSEG